MEALYWPIDGSPPTQIANGPSYVQLMRGTRGSYTAVLHGLDEDEALARPDNFMFAPTQLLWALQPFLKEWNTESSQFLHNWLFPPKQEPRIFSGTAAPVCIDGEWMMAIYTYTGELSLRATYFRKRWIVIVSTSQANRIGPCRLMTYSGEF